MKRVTYECDSCGTLITDTVFKLTCYAKSVVAPHLPDADVAVQNHRQNMAEQDHTSRHLCRACKDKLTDGLFIV